MVKSFGRRIKKYKEYLLKEESFKQFEGYLETKTFLPSLHIVKQNNIYAYRQKYKYEVLIETGTYLGDMVEAQKMNFKSIYSIELSQDLFQKAVERFKSDKHIKILEGDSSLVLKDILIELESHAIFWLDGHYSGDITAKGEKETPILSELEQIIKHNNSHVILIDDARLFTGDNDYPTIPDLCQFILAINPDKEIIIADDIIRITPK